MRSLAPSTARPGGSSSLLCLGIESTAHTFAVAIVEERDGKGIIRSDVKDIYRPPAGSGIHPREAATQHLRKAKEVLTESLQRAQTKLEEVDIVAFSQGPGLGPCLRIGAVMARTLAAGLGRPLVPVHHGVGHIELGAMLTGAQDPIVLLVSGGHTMINAHTGGRWRIFGETLDLTVGQLLDQFGRALGYSSPCGARIEALARDGRELLTLPYSVKGNDVSYSGLLTEAKKLVRQGKRIEDVCYSIQETAFAMLAEVTERALAFAEKEEVLLAGGVAANRRLQEMLKDMCEARGARLHTVPLEYSGDCGAQIAWTGILAYKAGVTIPIAESWIRQSWRLDQADAPWRG